MTRAAVVVVSPEGDVHGDTVSAALKDAAVSTVRLDADRLLRAEVTWTPHGPLRIGAHDGFLVDHDTTVWWRRPGTARPELDDALEVTFVQDEAAVILPGLLEASSVRWVDPPWVMTRARLKPLQLATAVSLGHRIPASMITGYASDAVQFAAGQVIVAKPVSSGFGIAPNVDVVAAAELAHVDACPTLLQELVIAQADMRVVTIDDRTFGWVRHRAVGDPPDWRQRDPTGAAFGPTVTEVPDGVVEITRALGLTFSVQDWLVTETGPIFLEVNVQGQWLFLPDAERLVVPALVEHLRGSHG